jgi:RND family efflux transporter MFP subunit
VIGTGGENGTRMRRWINRKVAQALLATAALAVGGVAAAALILAQEEPERAPTEQAAPLVETVRAERRDVPMTVRGYGTVEVRTRSRIVPELSGRVASVHPDLQSGGFIESGEVLLEIERRDYELALAEAQSELERAQAAQSAAEARIAEAEARLRDAEEELERTESLYEENVANFREVTRARVERDVAAAQLESAQADREEAASRIRAAQVAIDRAKLNLERTRLTFPFDAVVLNQEVDAGQYVAAGQSVGEVYGTEAMEIPVPLEDAQLQWFPAAPMLGRAERERIPPEQLPEAVVRSRFAGEPAEWRGRVVRLGGEIDRRSRMVRVVVRVDDPLGGSGQQRPALMPGMFVRVEIQGRTLQDIVPLPRHAVREGEVVWIAEDGRLVMRSVEVGRRTEDRVYVRSGVEAGERVIVSAIDTATNGMAVRVAEEEQDGSDPSDQQARGPDSGAAGDE